MLKKWPIFGTNISNSLNWMTCERPSKIMCSGQCWISNIFKFQRKHFSSCNQINANKNRQNKFLTQKLGLCRCLDELWRIFFDIFHRGLVQNFVLICLVHQIINIGARFCPFRDSLLPNIFFLLVFPVALVLDPFCQVLILRWVKFIYNLFFSPKKLRWCLWYSTNMGLQQSLVPSRSTTVNLFPRQAPPIVG